MDQAPVLPPAHVTLAELSADRLAETVTTTSGTAANGTPPDPDAAADGGRFSNGSYAVTGCAAAVTVAINGLVLTPAAHEVAPGQSATTGSTILTLSSDNRSALDSIASVVATAVASPITAAPATGAAATTDEKAASPFAGMAITNPNFGQSETAGQTASIAGRVKATAAKDAPVIGGVKGRQATQDTATLKHATASVSDVDTSMQDSLAIVLDSSAGIATNADGTLTGTGLTKTGTGACSLTAAAPAMLTSKLQALSFTRTGQLRAVR